MAAKALHLSAVAIVPEDSLVPSGNGESSTVSAKLYDSYARRGPVYAMLGLPFSTLQLLRLLRKLESRCVVASTPSPFIPFQALIASRILNVGYVLDVRDSWEMETITHQGLLRNVVKKWLEKLCAQSADKVWTVTSTLMERLRQTYTLDPHSVYLVPNGADRTLFRPAQASRPIDLLFLGSFARYRNIDGVLEALGVLAHVRPNSRVVFVGGEKTPFHDRGSELSTIEFRASVPREMAARIVAEARLGIVSFSNEDVFRGAIGAKAYEYIACGVPLACLGPAGDSELRDMVESRKLGFYSSNPAEFAEKAARILSDNDLWTQLSGNCINASSEFDRAKVSQRALKSIVDKLSSR